MTEPLVPGKTAERKRRTQPREVRRAQLITATINSIARHGIAGTTLSTVTEDAGLSLGIVNFHFESKQKLLEETLLYLAHEHHDQWKKVHRDTALGPDGKLLAVVDAHFHPRICSRKKLAVWFAFYGEGGRRAVYRSLVDAMDDERLALSTDLCHALAEAEGGSPTAPAEIARTLECLYDGLWLNMLMYPGAFPRERARAQVHAYLASVLPGHFACSDPDMTLMPRTRARAG